MRWCIDTICMLNLQVTIQSTSVAIRHVCELTASMKSILTSFSPAVSFVIYCDSHFVTYSCYFNNKI